LVVPDFEHIPAVTYWPCNNNGPSASGKWFEQAVSFVLDTMNMTRGTLVTTNKRVKKTNSHKGSLDKNLHTRSIQNYTQEVLRKFSTESTDQLILKRSSATECS